MTELIDVELPDALDGQRVDRVVSLVAAISRSAASTALAAGRVTLDGVVVDRSSIRVAAGSRLTVELEEVDNRLVPDPDLAATLVLAYEDDEVAVVDKPAGLVVHPGSGVTTGTLAHALLARFPEVAGVGPSDRPGIVHRLDKGTSGLLMVARTNRARESLSAQLQGHSVEREYRTLVWGDVEAEQGVIDAPLGRSPGNALRRAVVASGRPARTHYQVESRHVFTGADGGSRSCTLVRCRLETGRTHQIRAHMTAIGHPVVGDATYRGSSRASGLALAANRPFLHAEILGFDHPSGSGRLRFVSPLPPDLAAVVAQLGPPLPR